MRFFLPAMALMLAVLPAAGVDESAMAEGGPASEAAGRMVVPPGFAVDLIAGEPEVVQPIAMCFDPRGRLWVAEGLTYPARAPEGKGSDRILIFEDKDGDGKFETRKVFIEGLNLVSGLETGFGGVYVGAAPYLQFIPDMDGDDVPDSAPQVLLDGFGYQDTHETLNSFIWGPDGWLWGCHGIFTNSRVGAPGTPDDKRVAINAGIWRFNPMSKVFEVVAHGTSNPWGLDFNDSGDAFVEACVIPHLWNIIPGGYYQRQAGSPFNPNIYEPLTTIADHQHWTGSLAEHAHWGHEGGISQSVSDAGGGHAHCGFAICLSDAFPAEYRGSALFFNIHGHRMNRDTLARSGSGWVGSHAPDVMFTMDRWFLGISIKPGPDGALYFSDWQDPTSCHRADPLRWDRTNGRLFRLRNGEAKGWTGDLRKESDLALAQAQSGRDEWRLRMGRRVLQERVAAGKAIDPKAFETLREIFAKNPDPTRRLRALWCLRTCGAVDGAFLPAALTDKEPVIRAWAVRMVFDGLWSATLTDPLLKAAAAETDPSVLLAFCSALQRAPDEVALPLCEILARVSDPKDANLTRMLWFGMERLVPKQTERTWKAALSCPDPRLLRWTARRVNGNGLPPILFTTLRDQPDKSSILLDAIRERLNAAPDDMLSAEQMHVLSDLSKKGNATATTIVARLGDPEARNQLWTQVANAKASGAQRQATLGILSANSTGSEAAKWEALLDDSTLRVKAMELRRELLNPDLLTPRLSSFSSSEKAALIRLMMRDKQAARIIGWIKDGKLDVKDVPADVVAWLRDVSDPAVKTDVAAMWGEPAPDAESRRKAIADWTRKLTPEALAKADRVKGRAIFDRTCAACHKLFGEGGQVGPELTGGQRTELAHWLDNVLDPNAQIGQGYELHEVTKTDGTTAMGMLASQDNREVVLRLVGIETRISRAEVKEVKSLKRSMMPEGLFSAMSDEEVRDLIGYLMSPGQVAK